jgi:autotransporter-associated beta strand protein
MKTRKLLSIALILGALLWPASFARTAQGQPGGKRLILNTGVIALGGGQILRLTINGQAGNDTVMVRFRRMYYAGSTNGGVWKSSIAAQDLSDTITLAANEAASADVSQGGFGAVRIEAIISGYTGTTHVNGGTLQIINSDGSVAAFFDIPAELV